MQTPSNAIQRARLVGCAGLVLGGVVLLVPLLWRITDQVGAAAGAGAPVRPDEALSAVVAAAALVGVTWLAGSVLLEVVSLVPGTLGRSAARAAEVVTPRLVRRAAGALLGIGVVAGLAPGASVAAPTVSVAADVATVRPPLPDPGLTPLPDPGWAPGTGTAPATAPERRPAPVSSPAPAPGWVPTRPAVRTHPDVRVLSPSPRSGRAAPPTEVVVRRGDSLWSIAARHLGRDASEAEVARAWPAWFDANREVVGDDPDLLLPGQVLHPPPRSAA